MELILVVIHELIYRPIFNILVVYLNIFGGELGFAIIALTITIRLILLKPSMAGNDMQKQMTDIQPKLKEIQEIYKDNPQKMSEETMKLLKWKGTGPLKGCLMMLIQIPIFLALFWVINWFSRQQIDKSMIYSFIDKFSHNYLDITAVHHMFLNVDLFVSGSIVLAILAWVAMYFQMKLTLMNKPAMPTSLPGWPNMPDMTQMMWLMNNFLVWMMAIFVYTTPAGIGIYIITSALFTITQNTIQYKEFVKIKLKETFSFKK